jgi:hypothetical protein
MTPAYLLLDGARMGAALEEAKALCKDCRNLYSGKRTQRLGKVAPYLCSLEEYPGLVTWFLEKGWGRSWGMAVSTRIEPDLCLRHFRKFLTVWTEEQKQLYFRFYDPRVLHMFLPTCDRQQLTDFFGPVDAFLLEDEDGVGVVEYRQEGGVLQRKQIDNKAAFLAPQN